jgi:deoxycytidylate deaminase
MANVIEFLVRNKHILELLFSQAQESQCHDRHVSCILCDKDGSFLAGGINEACGKEKCPKLYGDKCTARHAELTALLNKNAICNSSAAHTAWVNMPPCDNCCRALYEFGVKQLVICGYEPSEVCDARYTPFDVIAISMKLLNDVFGYGWSINQQAEHYHKSINWPIVCASKKDRIQEARPIMLSLHQEVAEVADTITWKPWRNTDKANFCYHDLLSEIADIYLALQSLTMCLHISEDEVKFAFGQKLRENEKRKEEGYYAHS